ncbi:MAG: enoyl-CoA hydratase-related protein [Burkholderiaceae bacterium]
MIGISRAKELSLTGNFLFAAQARDWGLVNRVLQADDLMPQARALARDMLSVLPHMLVAYKKLIDDGYAASFAEGLAIERSRADAANGAVRAEDIEARRVEIRVRAHQQSRNRCAIPFSRVCSGSPPASDVVFIQGRP